MTASLPTPQPVGSAIVADHTGYALDLWREIVRLGYNQRSHEGIHRSKPPSGWLNNRTGLSQGLGFSRQDRDINVKRVGFVANLLSRHGVFVIVAMISPYRESRDVKGLYAKARAGEIKGITGIDDPYEPPLKPDVVCLGGQETPLESTTRILQALEQLGYLPDL